MHHQRSLTLDHVWIATAIALLAIGPLFTPVPPNDLWFHIATGRRIMAESAIPATDSFSYTQFGQPFYNQAWLAQLTLFGLNVAGGVPLLLLAHALLILVGYGLLLHLCVRRSGNLRLSVALFLVTLPVAFPAWNIRPQTGAFPLFAAFLYILTAYRLGWFNRLWLLPLLMAVWVNVHGTFPLGLALIGATAVGMVFARWQTKDEGRPTEDEGRPTEDEGRPTAHGRTSPPASYFRPSSFGFRPLIGWGLLTALAVLLNPAGVGVLGYVRSLTGNNAVTQLVSEWAAPTIREPGGLVFFVFLLVGALLLIYAPRKPDLADWLMGLPLLWLALGAGRNVVWFAFVAVPVVVVAAASLLPAPKKAARGVAAMNGLLIGMLGLAVLLCLPWVKPLWLAGPQGELLKNTPVAAVAWLQTQSDRPHRLYHSEAHGSYLTYAAPEQPVFIDPRIELYPFAQWQDYLALNSGSDVAALTARYGFDGMLLSKEYQAPLIERMRAETGWEQQYEDDLVMYFGR